MVLVLRAVGGRDFEGGYEGPQICTSQWGYVYDCRRITPILKISTSNLLIPLTIIPQQRKASFTVCEDLGSSSLPQERRAICHQKQVGAQHS